MLHLWIIIVSYNTCDLLRNCLASILRAAAATAHALQVEIIVVDNASTDGSVEMVRVEFPGVEVLALPENHGFTGGNNIALRQLGLGVGLGEIDLAKTSSPANVADKPPHFILLLNPDTEVVGDALWQMVSFLNTTPKAGVCGAYLRYGDGRFQHGAFRFPSLAQVALDFFPLAGVPGAHRLHDSRMNGRYAQSLWHGNNPFPVDFVLGAALMVRGEAIAQIGLLDEAYFMYCEESDWCLRLHEAGWGVYAVPTARITHHEGQSSRQVRWQSYVRLWKSRLRFYNKHTKYYSSVNRFVLSWLIRLGIRRRQQTAQQRFTRGELTQQSLTEELAAYDSILALIQ